MSWGGATWGNLPTQLYCIGQLLQLRCPGRPHMAQPPPPLPHCTAWGNCYNPSRVPRETCRRGGAEAHRPHPFVLHESTAHSISCAGRGNTYNPPNKAAPPGFQLRLHPCHLHLEKTGLIVRGGVEKHRSWPWGGGVTFTAFSPPSFRINLLTLATSARWCPTARAKLGIKKKKKIP